MFSRAIRGAGAVRAALFTPLIYALYTRAAMASSVTACNGNTPSGGSGTGTPWDAPLCQLYTVLTGTPATVISIIAIFVAGIALIFGEDLGAFARRLLMVIIAAALIIAAGKFFTFFASAFGAHI
jgi:type IV secretion system protein TrbC